jgi:hypothetical protein
MFKSGIFLLACAAVLAGQPSVTISSGGQVSAAVPGPGPSMISTFRVMAGEMIGGSPVKSAPYSAQAVTQSTQTLADGNRIVNNTSAAVYRDSDGRERREQSLPNIGALTAQGAPSKNILISDPVAGANYSLDPNTKTAMKLPSVKTLDLPPPPASGQPVFVRNFASVTSSGPNVMYFGTAGGAGSTPNVEQLGSQVINGVAADGTRTTVTIAAGQIGNEQPIQVVDEVWRSSELQVIVQSQHSDPRMGTTSYSLTNISRSEPSPTLFQVPPDYTVQDAPTPIRMARPVAQ